MNKAKLKTYAPQARKDFIAAVTARAHQLGISETNGQLDIAPAEKTGDLVLIGGQAWPAKVYPQRERLIQRMQKDGFAHTLDAIAYTWFNRFAALRYMEIHDYLGHGHRVLSSREGGLPDILAHATELVGVLPGLKAQPMADMKLAGNQDGELYRLLLVAQCNALSSAMPFLFERIDDETELLLPDNLLRTDSVITQLVGAIPEQDWADIEIIGWLYQFYISEKKDQVIGKVVKSEDIPAATQLFTPNWIVKYMVQNSLGAQWLATYPDSPLKGQMEFYIEPAEQTNEVKAQLAAITPSQLNPEELTLIDPACGSGHILVEAYELFKAIYLERGYRLRDIPRLILEKNLYGLDIDERAAQLAGFALLMKARADDRRLLDNPPKLNVLSLQESTGMDADELTRSLHPLPQGEGWGEGDLRSAIGHLLDTFTHAKTFGSLIQIPKLLQDGLPGLEEGIAKAIESGDVFAKAAAQDLAPLVQQARILVMKFDAVVANPPYMGVKGMNAEVKKFAKDSFPDAKSDLFACFIERGYTLAKDAGHSAMVTMQGWMFLSSFERMRERLLRQKTITTMAQIGYNSFPSMNSKIAQATVFSIVNRHISNFAGCFIDLNSAPQSADKDEILLRKDPKNMFKVVADLFLSLPGVPVAYWVSQNVIESFKGQKLSDVADVKGGMSTSDNDRFLRLWQEVSIANFGLDLNRNEALASSQKWFPYNKGGEYRRWYGNHAYVVNWQFDGAEIKEAVVDNPSDPNTTHWSRRIFNTDCFFKSCVTWGDINSSLFTARANPVGFVSDGVGIGAYDIATRDMANKVLALLNSCVLPIFTRILCPTLHFNSGPMGRMPIAEIGNDFQTSDELIREAQRDWDAYERSWNFQSLPLLGGEDEGRGVSVDNSAAITKNLLPLTECYRIWITQNRATIVKVKRLEEENNRLFIDAYGLQDELTPDIPIEQITLTVNPAYRYGGNLSEAEQWTRFRQDTMQELISYAIGCMMGRYSLDEPGLIYAHAGNVGFDATRYKTFPADADGIIPITDEFWFEDDAANRIREFILAVWPAPTFEENMAWLAESLGAKGNETPDETLRRYLASSFFKDHLQTYKKRPIYWLFSSGKQGAFQALVYLHRYHEGTLARMRAEYVVPLTGKMQSRIEMLEKDKDAAPSTAARNKIAKQIEALKKKHVELLAYDEKLRHTADRRISLDLDDGVKVNYGKFGDLLAEVKAITGGSNDD